MGIFRLDFRKEFSNLNSPFTAAAIQMMLAMNDKSFRENIEKLITTIIELRFNKHLIVQINCWQMLQT